MSEPESPASGPVRAELVVDLDALRANVRTLAAACAPAALMVVVKADGYGHGMVPVARAAREAGADWLGVATIDEALALRAAGDTGPLLCWLGVPGEDYAAAIEADVDVTAYSTTEVGEIAAAARRTGRRARMQLKVDTGLSRGGATAADWPGVVAAALAAARRGRRRGHRHLVALRLRRRARPPGQRRPGAGVRRGARRRRRRPASTRACDTCATRPAR